MIPIYNGMSVWDCENLSQQHCIIWEFDGYFILHVLNLESEYDSWDFKKKLVFSLYPAPRIL